LYNVDVTTFRLSAHDRVCTVEIVTQCVT